MMCCSQPFAFYQAVNDVSEKVDFPSLLSCWQWIQAIQMCVAGKRQLFAHIHTQIHIHKQTNTHAFLRIINVINFFIVMLSDPQRDYLPLLLLLWISCTRTHPITQSPNNQITYSPNQPITQSPNYPIAYSPNHPIHQKFHKPHIPPPWPGLLCHSPFYTSKQQYLKISYPWNWIFRVNE